MRQFLLSAACMKCQAALSFFTHIRVHNRTEKRLRLDLRDRSRVVYPNQWGVYSRPQREIIDEERRIPTRLTTELKKKLVDDFHSGALTPLRSRPNSALEVWQMNCK